MWKVRSYNKIDPIIHKFLIEDAYKVSDSIEEPDAIILRSAKLHDYDFEKNQNLLAIGRAGAGTNNIPIDECTKRGIVVFNSPGANANAVAELAIASLIMSSRQIIKAINWVNAQETDDLPALVEKNKSQFIGPEIMGKTIGIIGLGSIGRRVANKAASLGMKVLGYDPYISVNSAWVLNPDITRVASIEAMIPNCDYISLHLPVNENTKGLFNHHLFNLFKDDTVLLNFARADIVNEHDLLKAIENGQIGNYITDFPTNGLMNNEKITLIPHLGASSPESEHNCAVMAATQLHDYLESGNILNSVNFPLCCLEPSKNPRITIAYDVSEAKDTIEKALSIAGQPIAMATATKGNVGYCILETHREVDFKERDYLMALPGVLKVRFL